MKLYTRVVIHRNWEHVDIYELGEMCIEKLPEQVKRLVGKNNATTGHILIEIALWNEKERTRKMEEE